MAGKKGSVKVTRVKQMPSSSGSSDKKSEIAGVCWIALGLFLFVCVISPSPSHWIGKAGQILQHLIFGTFGLAAYALGPALVALGVGCIAQRAQGLKKGKVAGCVTANFSSTRFCTGRVRILAAARLRGSSSIPSNA